ncbi:MAG: magnesium transporter [Candidatus Fischerbacteria bacterium RBG_13_37_8]|uniref:Magnesium transporter MgtE n=1 Tax=Candidatus Fischerbacteria bacterium RBG_13_37_8 TaxID=1817863 RepID=A0A1F5VPC4_9BACT|nr:MAG: magnesium transporter [Candidatus Fischerbacteria bacterium RBG_13_37_8]
MRVNEILVQEIEALIQKKDYRSLKEALPEILPADLVEILYLLPTVDRLLIFRLLKKDMAVEVFSLLESNEQEELLHLFTDDNAKEILQSMAPDDRADLFDELPAGIVNRLIALLPQDQRDLMNRMLNYPDNSAGRLMTTEYVNLREHMNVASAIHHIRTVAPDKETIYYAYVIDDRRYLIGIVSLRQLLLAQDSMLVENIMHKDFISVKTTDDQEYVAKAIKKYDLLAIPVVDLENRLVGIVTVDDVIDVIDEEATEDFHKMAAMQATEDSYFSTGFFMLARKRILWLILLLLAYNFTQIVLRHYADTLKIISLIFFMPMIIGTGGNAGTQSATLIIRGLAVGEIRPLDFFKIVFKESFMGILMGLLLGIVLIISGAIMGADMIIAYIASIALIVIVLSANLAGALLPLIAKLLKLDPAIMAGPVITIIVDILGIVIYFEVAKFLLNI